MHLPIFSNQHPESCDNVTPLQYRPTAKSVLVLADYLVEPSHELAQIHVWVEQHPAEAALQIAKPEESLIDLRKSSDHTPKHAGDLIAVESFTVPYYEIGSMLKDNVYK